MTETKDEDALAIRRSPSATFKILDLPFELRSLILSFLPRPQERAVMARTCRALRDEVEELLYSEIVLRDTQDSKSLHHALQARPQRLLMAKHFTYLYSFGEEGFGSPEFRYGADAATQPTNFWNISPAAGLEPLHPQFYCASLRWMQNLNSLKVTLCKNKGKSSSKEDDRTVDELPTAVAELHGLPEHSAAAHALATGSKSGTVGTWKTARCIEHLLMSGAVEVDDTCNSESQMRPKLIELDFGFVNNNDHDLWDIFLVSEVFNIAWFKSIIIRHFDSCDVDTFSDLSHRESPRTHHLEFATCEVNAMALSTLFSKTCTLKSLRLSRLENIWDGWDEEGQEMSGKGRWIDILTALRRSSQLSSLEILELTSQSKHCIVPKIEQPLDFTDFTRLNELTLDAHISIRGLPDTLRSLTFVRPKDFPGACLPLLENRLREVRKCSLKRDIKRTVIFRIPDRSRGYESLRVMAETWTSIGFSPSIEVHA